MPVSHKFLNALVLSLVFTFSLNTSTIAGDDWKPLDPTHVSMKAPMIEKEADAEVLIWEVQVDDSAQTDLIMNHYIRTKIFTERGVTSQGQVEIEYFGNDRIKDIVARTIKPDGTIVELKKDAIFDRTKVKISGLKLNVKSFVMPNVEPGSIIEYRYREVHANSDANNLKLYFQRTIPIHSVKYFLKPSEYLGMMSTFTMNGPNNLSFVKEKNGFYSSTMNNVPAYREEANMPPEDKVRTWMLVFYTREKPDPQKYWTNVGKLVYENTKPRIKINDDVRKAAAEATTGATTSDEKLSKLLEFCRVKIKNVASDTSGVTSEERKKLKDNNNSADTLKRGYGDSSDIDFLFAALASAAGFESRLAMIPNRSDFFFDPTYTTSYFLRGGEIAVRVDGQWKFYDPSSKYVTTGMLPWEYEGCDALITDPKEPVWVKTPMSSPEKSLEKTVGNLKLNEEGTLEGDIQIEYSGHLGRLLKNFNDDDSQEKREESFKNMLKSHVGAAEITNLKILNVNDPIKPFTYICHVKVPNYATRTGKRLFLQPAFFQFGEAAKFTSNDRRYPLYFKFPYTEQSEVQIDLPAGYALDNAESPGSFNAENVFKYDVSIGVTKDQASLIYKRKLSVNGINGPNGINVMLFPVNSYSAIKQVFDTIHKEDNHQITLKFNAATATK